MKVLADESDTTATWHYADEIIQLAAVWTEKKQGRGEDAPPTALHHRAGRGALAVYDGQAEPVRGRYDSGPTSGRSLALSSLLGSRTSPLRTGSSRPRRSGR